MLAQQAMWIKRSNEADEQLDRLLWALQQELEWRGHDVAGAVEVREDHQWFPWEAPRRLDLN